MKLFDVYPLMNVTPVKAKDCILWDENGKEYLDLYGGHAVISIGHSHPHYVAATQIKPNVMNLNMPPKLDEKVEQTVKPEIKLSNSITILIGKEDKIFWHQKDQSLTAADLNDTDYSAEGIRKTITDAQARAEDKDLFTVIIKPTDGASYKNLVDVLDEMEITKSTKYGIVEVAPYEQTALDEKVGK